MASVNLDYLYLHDANDEPTFLALDLDSLTATPTKQGSIRRLASGRRRAVLREGSDDPLEVGVEQVSRADRETLASWVREGRLILLRDPRGRALWGHAFALNVEEMPLAPDEAANLTFTFETITHSEEV